MKFLFIIFIFLLLQRSQLIQTSSSSSKIVCKGLQKNISSKDQYKCQIPQPNKSISNSDCKMQEIIKENYKILFCLKVIDKKQKLFIQLYELQDINIYDMVIHIQDIQSNKDLDGWEVQDIFNQFKENPNKFKIDENGIIKMPINYGKNNSKTKMIPFIMEKRIEGLPDVMKRELRNLKKQNRKLLKNYQNMINIIQNMQHQINHLSNHPSSKIDKLTIDEIINHNWQIINRPNQTIKFLKNRTVQSIQKKNEISYWFLNRQGLLVFQDIQRNQICKVNLSFRDFYGKWIMQCIKAIGENYSLINLVQRL